MVDVMVADKDSLDLTAALRAVGAVVEAVPVVDALFFHRTIARWLGLPEGRVDGAGAPVQWDYRYWKAELRREPERDAAAGIGAAAWCAALSSTAEGPVEVVRWWVKKDDNGRIAAAGWHGAPPKILDRSPPPTAPSPLPTDAATIARLFGEGDEGHGGFDDDDGDTVTERR